MEYWDNGTREMITHLHLHFSSLRCRVNATAVDECGELSAVPEGSWVPFLVQQVQHDRPGLEAGPVQPPVGAAPVLEVSPGHAGGHTQ